MQEIFDESTYKLDEDIMIGFERNDGYATDMAYGINNIKVEGDYDARYEIKKFASFAMGFRGLCHSIVPKNVMLTPATSNLFYIESSIKGDE